MDSLMVDTLSQVNVALGSIAMYKEGIALVAGILISGFTSWFTASPKLKAAVILLLSFGVGSLFNALLLHGWSFEVSWGIMWWIMGPAGLAAIGTADSKVVKKFEDTDWRGRPRSVTGIRTNGTEQK